MGKHGQVLKKLGTNSDYKKSSRTRVTRIFRMRAIIRSGYSKIKADAEFLKQEIDQEVIDIFPTL